MTPYLLDQALANAARRYADLAAIVAPEGETWSYRRLAARSAAWGSALRAAGCGHGARVGIWMAKSPEAVAAMWAAMRIGAMYVPFDPWAPSARVADLAADCGVAALAADGPHAEVARAWAQPPPILTAAGANDADVLPDAEGRTADDLAYILYTSGSTGVPKGVTLTHTHALNFTGWAGTEVGLRPGDRVANHAPFHFDLSIFDLWASLTRGATVCLLDSVTARFPRAVADWALERQITVWYAVPSALVQLLPDIERLAAGPLRAMLFAGEIFPPPALETWRCALPRAAFHNWYGPTETNVCTHYRLPRWRHGASTASPLPIGYACPNFELAIRGEAGEPTAESATGFLWVRGPGILAGYWGDPERSHQVSCERTFGGGPAERWYNTGDLVRRGEQGELYFEGRRDQVIKLRGYRISLREIERMLEACAGVRQAAVIAAGDESSLALVGYVTGDPDRVSEPELRRQLSERLPAYMLPERIEVLSSLPCTSSGKIDRQSLRVPAAGARA